MAGCGGEADSRPTAEPSSTPAQATSAQANTPTAIDEAMVAVGQTLFTQKACGSCHTIGGGRLVGPDLSGVTARRSQTWIMAMILNPDSMVRADSIARRLMGEYFTPMANQNLSREDATALYQFLLSVGGAESPAGTN